MSVGAFIGALLFTVFGLAELAFVKRSVYPSLQWHYEKAKVTQSQGVRPSTIMALVKFQSLVLMPILGFVLGGRMTSPG